MPVATSRLWMNMADPLHKIESTYVTGLNQTVIIHMISIKKNVTDIWEATLELLSRGID